MPEVIKANPTLPRQQLHRERVRNMNLGEIQIIDIVVAVWFVWKSELFGCLKKMCMAPPVLAEAAGPPLPK